MSTSAWGSRAMAHSAVLCGLMLATGGCSGSDDDETLGETPTIDGGSVTLDGGDEKGVESDLDAAPAQDAALDATTISDASMPEDSSAPDAADSSAPDAADSLPTCDAGIATDAVLAANLRVTADDKVKIWFNGELVAETTSTWQTLKEYQVSVHLYPGKENVIAFEAENIWEQSGYDRGLIAELAYTLGADTAYVNSDASWKLSSSLADGWTALDFDDTAWANATTLGKSGISPWTSVPLNSEAEWIWSFVPSGTAAEKPDGDIIYTRKTFYMDASGKAADSAVCR